MEQLKIAVAGTGYVGLSIATLLAQHHNVMAVDIVPEKVELINNRKSPIQDEYIEKYLAEEKLDLRQHSMRKRHIAMQTMWLLLRQQIMIQKHIILIHQQLKLSLSWL